MMESKGRGGERKRMWRMKKMKEEERESENGE